jgi:hypothetical protein
MNDHVLRHELANAAMRRGAEFDWQHVAERVLMLACVSDRVPAQPAGGRSCRR